uniref:Solute carrier family 22 member 13a n=1 Tax=Amphilophus citrinellus TaxID=61819 RepID=A0A3Q0RHN8_AMPCI
MADPRYLDSSTFTQSRSPNPTPTLNSLVTPITHLTTVSLSSCMTYTTPSQTSLPLMTSSCSIKVPVLSWGACVTQLFSAIGQCVLAGMIYGIRHWRLAQLISAVPCRFSARFIPESARWLLSRGRKEEAKQLIVKAAAINKRPVSESLLAEVLNHIYQGKVFKHTGLYKNCCHRVNDGCVMRDFVFSLNLSIYSMYLDMENFGLNIFLTQVLFGAFEIPSVLLSMWLLEIFGRKILFIATLLIGGVASMLILAVPEGKRSQFVFLTLSQLSESTFLPSCFRPTATALGSISARLGSLLAPLLNMLAMYHSAIPIVVFSCLTLLGGALGFLLPETKRRELPETAEESGPRMVMEQYS